MATGNGILTNNVSGSVGNLTFRVRNGQQIVSAKVVNVKNPRTEGQMGQRIKWCNVIAMHKAGAPVLKEAFENKTGKQSDYNCFMAVNLQLNKVYLTKNAYALGACIAAPYMVTQGSLPAVQVTGNGEQCVTDLAVGSLTIGATTTVADLSAAILANNDNWQEGDQLSFLLYKQLYNAETDIPYVVCQKFKTTINLTDDTQVLTIFPACACGVKDGCLAIGSGLPQGAFAWIHSRKSSSKTLVSTQHLQVYNDLYATYSSESARTAAIQSYGVTEDAFLTPDNTSTNTSVTSTDSVDNESDAGGSNDAGSGTGNSGNTGGSTPDDDETI